MFIIGDGGVALNLTLLIIYTNGPVGPFAAA